MKIDRRFWTSKRVFVTGHTGFKGAWLVSLLKHLGAETFGYSLAPQKTDESLHALGLKANQEIIGDIRDFDKLKNAIRDFEPDVVLHLAAQALVLPSYEDPLETFSTNILGTANVALAALESKSLQVFLNVTSDKCYENREWVWPYRENDAMGGRDPYSASKGCAEIVGASVRDSYYAKRNVAMPSGRAGNVIGGGDWSAYRIVPDLMRSFSKNEAAHIRNPNAIRPWQHVLEPLRAYLIIAQAAANDPRHSKGWNIAPDPSSIRTVHELAETATRLWGRGAGLRVDPVANAPHEATLLKLDSTQLRHELKWAPLFDFEQSIALTVDWYKRFYEGTSASALCDEQIETMLARAEC